MGHQGQPPYEPEGNTPIAVLYAHGGYTTSAEVARAVGVAPNTIRKWDREGVWPHWALQRVGFEVNYVGFEEEETEEQENEV